MTIAELKEKNITELSRIARTLEISEKTVRNHISSIYRKLDIYDRSQVVIYAMKKGLVDIQETR